MMSEEVDVATPPLPSATRSAGEPLQPTSERNPVGGSGGDGDTDVPSDLPYACNVPFSRDIQDFLGPTRVVGRLPDVDGDEDPAYLVGLLRTARGWKSLSKSTYRTGFAVTADVWKSSTRASARKLFGSSRVDRVPPKGPAWPKSRLARRAHFINCHGAPIDPCYYGEGIDGSFPVAHRSRSLAGLRKGTVAAAECCYGAQLYDPESLGVDSAIANAYMKKGTYGFLGSTTIAYGPASGNGEADLICQYFLRYVQNGASLGRATLEARQEYVRKHSPVSPVDLKTLAQFYLLGDASIHPVRAARVSAKTPAATAGGPGRKSRRRRLAKKGHSVSQKVSSVLSKADRTVKRTTKKPLTTALSKAGMDVSGVRVFEVRSPRPTQAKNGPGEEVAVRRVRDESQGTFHVMIESARSGPAKSKNQASGDARIKTRRLIVAREVKGKVVEMRELYPR